MSSIPSSARRRPLTRAVLLAAAGACVALAAAPAGGAGPGIARAELASPACPTGSVRGSDPLTLAGVARHCLPLGGAESARDLTANLGQLQARSTAPFRQSRSGAYASALAQADSLPTAGPSLGGGGRWSQYGSAPLCSAPSTVGSVCPAANAENGTYSRTGAEGRVQEASRVSSITYDPANTAHWWASPVTGGVYETTDAGGHWHSIGDNLPTQSVGAIAYDAPLHRLIVGTGDNSYGGDGIAGHGIDISDDDGATWSVAAGIPDLALSFRVVVAPDAAASAAHVASGELVYAATSKGLFRSTTGGGSFLNENLPTTPAGYSPNCAGDTTSSLCFFANDVTDVVVKGSTTANGQAGAVIAVVGWRAGAAHDTNPDGSDLMACSQNGSPTVCLQSPQNGVYISHDGTPNSFTWQSHGNSPNVTGGYAPDNVAGRNALAIAHGAGQSSDAVYSLVEDVQKFNGCPDIVDGAPAPVCDSTVTGETLATVLDGMYVSYDFGTSWTKIMDWAQLQKPGTGSALFGQTGYGPGVQGWYNLWVDADPTTTDGSGHPTRVLFGLEEIWENNMLPTANVPGSVLSDPYSAHPGGTAATDPWLAIGRYWNACTDLNTGIPCNPNLKNNPTGGTTPHPDQHADALIPDGSGGVTLVAGNDGGVYAQHVASGADFTNDGWGDGANVGIGALQPYDVSISKDGTAVSGLQDNGEVKITPDGRESNIFDGDGFYTVIDPDNSKNIIEEYTYGTLSLSNDGGTTWMDASPNALGVTPGLTSPRPFCTSSTALFATPIEQDPTRGGHVLVGCSAVQEATTAYSEPCSDPVVCAYNQLPWTTVFTFPAAASGATFKPSALGARGDADYVGACGYCDVLTQGVPFQNAIATNVGGGQPPKAGTTQGWHLAAMNCSGCGTANGKLPNRYITSIQVDTNDPNIVYVTLGGYGRRWIPPGALGDAVANVGTGHVFMSKDHGENFTDISGNLPDIAANWVMPLPNELLVATDLGVFAAAKPDAPISWAHLGSGLPNSPAFVLRQNPGNPNQVFVATYGRSDWVLTLTGNVAAGTAPTSTTITGSPNTSAASPGGLAAVLLSGVGLATVDAAARRRRRRLA